MRLEEARLFVESEPLLEDGEGPRWKFRYDNFDVDPTPDILLLGSYKHPNTGNNLVGGINLHYLSSPQIEQLAKALPKIMGAKNLKARYWTGRELAPEVFNEYYRTYDAKYIRGVKQDVMYPKFGFMKSAKDWIKKKVANIFKTKKQKEKEAQPEYPDDLANMQDRLNNVVQQLQQQGQPEEPLDEPADTPEMRRARDAYDKIQKQKAQRQAGLGDTDDDILRRNIDDYIDDATKDTEEPERTEQTPDERRRDIERDRQENQKELLDPDNEIDNDDLEEAIIYYSPIKKQYIMEHVL